MPLPACSNRMPRVSQLTPNGGVSVGQIVIAAPPAMAILFSARSAPDIYAMDWPSGENTGLERPSVVVSVPGIVRDAESDKRRNWMLLLSSNAICVPSRETAAKVRPPPCAEKPSGSAIENRATGAGFEGLSRHAPAPATAPTTTALTTGSIARFQIGRW